MSVFGAVITDYLVQVRQKDELTYTIVASDCPSSGFDLMANTQCTIQVSTIKGWPWILEDGDPIYARIIAVNEIGESDPTDPVTGSTVFVPIVPGSPTQLANYPSGTSKTTASFTWSDGEDGGKVITDYKIESDQAIGTWVEFDTGVTG